jgi:tetraacyldisaccharide 4'-kinase
MAQSSPLLAPLTWWHRTYLWWRNFAYDMKFLPTYRPNVPVIALGGLLPAVAGRALFIETLIRQYSMMGVKIAVIFRNYRSPFANTQIVSDGKTLIGNPQTTDSEAYQIAKRYPTVIVAVDNKLARAASFVSNMHHPGLLIIEDAFHDRSVARDLNCVVIDSRIDLAKLPMHPIGPRRESLSALRRAHMCVMTNIPSSGPGNMDIYKRYTPAPAIGVRTVPQVFKDFVSGNEMEVPMMNGVPAVVFCGVENPQSFKSSLLEIGVQISEFLIFPDRCPYSGNELASVKRYVDARKPQRIITTERDAARLKSLKNNTTIPWELVCYLETEPAVTGEVTLNYQLKERINRDLPRA